jgi:hypothetical protein
VVENERSYTTTTLYVFKAWYLRTRITAFTVLKTACLNFLQELPLKAWFPMDMQQTWNYLLIFGFQLIIVIVGPMVNIGTDTFITGLIIHACGEFRVLKKSLRLLKQRALQLQQEGNSSRSQHSAERDTMLSWPLIDFVNYGVFRGALNGSVGVR